MVIVYAVVESLAAARISPSFCYLEGSPCDNDDPTADHDLPVETRLARCLLIWRNDASAVFANGRTVEQEISFLLEWFICDCVAYDPAERVKSWWSDGVVQLRVEHHSRDMFKLVGVTWIGCQGLAPFDIDVELSPEDDTRFAKCVFRIGVLDHHGRPILGEPGKIVELRSRPNNEWAMAVELTPP